MIMYESDEAATFQTGISGWVSANGRFYGNDEDLARFDGCTHKLCDCGQKMEKFWTKCTECRAKASDERYKAMPFKEWEGEPLVLFGDDQYFWSLDDLIYYVEDNPEVELQLVICEPNYAPEISDTHGEEYYPEDQYLDDVAPELAKRIAELNEWIAKEKPILSWGAGRFRTTVKLPDAINEELPK